MTNGKLKKMYALKFYDILYGNKTSMYSGNEGENNQSF
jgi:hypothetical protein